jgi:hypothetical protein
MPSPHGVSWIRHVTVTLAAVAAAAVAVPTLITHGTSRDVASGTSLTTRHASSGRPMPMWWSAS